MQVGTFLLLSLLLKLQLLYFFLFTLDTESLLFEDAGDQAVADTGGEFVQGAGHLPGGMGLLRHGERVDAQDSHMGIQFLDEGEVSQENVYPVTGGGFAVCPEGQATAAEVGELAAMSSIKLLANGVKHLPLHRSIDADTVKLSCLGKAAGSRSAHSSASLAGTSFFQTFLHDRIPSNINQTQLWKNGSNQHSTKDLGDMSMERRKVVICRYFMLYYIIM